jgi:hypothetical protein
MIEAYSHVWVMCFAAVWGALVGRVFAVEGQDRPSAILAAGYCGAGTGLLSGPPFALLLMLIGNWARSTAQPGGLLDAVDDVGAGLLWGPIGGAAGGLLIGLLVVLLGGGRRASLE